MESSIPITRGLPSTVGDLKTARQAIQVCSQLVTLHQRALTAWTERKYVKFDALVGDTQCQIRVHWLQAHVGQLEPAVKRGIEKLDGLATELKGHGTPKKPKKQQPITAYLKGLGLPIEVDHRVRFLTLCFALTQGKSSKRVELSLSERLDDRALMRVIGCGRSLNKRLIRLFRAELALTSCDYIQEEAKGSTLRRLIACRQTDRMGRSSVPCAIGMEVLLHRMQKQSHPLILSAVNPDEDQRLPPLGYAHKNGEGFVRAELSADKPCMVIEGCTKVATIEKLAGHVKRIGLIKMLVACAAKHPQYHGNVKNEPIPFAAVGLPQERIRFEELKDLAEKEGLCAKNHAIFSIYHILFHTWSGVVAKQRRSGK